MKTNQIDPWATYDIKGSTHNRRKLGKAPNADLFCNRLNKSTCKDLDFHIKEKYMVVDEFVRDALVEQI